MPKNWPNPVPAYTASSPKLTGCESIQEKTKGNKGMKTDAPAVSEERPNRHTMGTLNERINVFNAGTDSSLQEQRRKYEDSWSLQ